MRAMMMRKSKYSNVKVIDERLGYGHDVKLVMMWMCFDDLIFEKKFVDHMPRSYNRSYIKIM